MSNAADMPSHAYIPGKTARHPEDAFDDLRNTARPGMTVSQLSQSAAFQAGLAFIAQGYFWEAHEVLEPVWMACPQNSQERALVQGLIQLANAELKAVMGRPNATRRLCDVAFTHLNNVTAEKVMGLDVTAIQQQIDSLRRRDF